VLGEHPITPVLLAKDLAAARDFYHDKLGLEILTENENAIVFKCGGGTHLDVTKSTVGTADSQTQASWQVIDLRAEVAELRARGSRLRTTTCPGSRPRAASPTSALPGRPGSSTRARTPLASCSSSSSRGEHRRFHDARPPGSQRREQQIGLAQPTSRYGLWSRGPQRRSAATIGC
jgi:catechol 2,3-dioxygenase-like lactoylglutathione lyase family enzyme